MSDDFERALRTLRTMLDLGYDLEQILELPVIPKQFHEKLRQEAELDENFVLTPARTISADVAKAEWLSDLDRSTWYYWPTLRSFLLSKKGWSQGAVRSLDDSSDRILNQLAPPETDAFDIRGLVLGFVQSGKTANFTALIAKAADAGYRLIVVLSGTDNGLRRQTNLRLKKELVGYAPPLADSVALPRLGKQWHEFTSEELHGDFQPGFANHAALQGSQPVLLVVKKNSSVLRRLQAWLEQAPPQTRHELPVLFIDDEADQASIDTRGSAGFDGDVEYEPPSVINGRIRELLQLFDRRAYVAYTATPFANVLIPHDVDDPTAGNDLYPKDFIIDLPKQPGYFGAEEFFGRIDPVTDEPIGGLDLIRTVDDEDIAAIEDGDVPDSITTAMIDFVLAGAARAERGQATAPAAMLIHTSSRIAEHTKMERIVGERFAELRDEWRYQRNAGIRERLRQRWEADQRPTIRSIDEERDRPFGAIEPHIGLFLESTSVRAINSETGEVLDYDREPDLKAIVIGGNRLARGLTIEGLLVSYFVRRTVTYDALMQMGRWFGFRGGYEDLTRIYTTAELGQWFSDLAMVENQLRQDIGIYEDLGLTPLQVGMRIWRHPAMQVTSMLKRRFASETTIKQSFELALEQTFKFPFRKPESLASLADSNLAAVRQLVGSLGTPIDDGFGPIWLDVSASEIVDFLKSYQQDPATRSMSTSLIAKYVEDRMADRELVSWTVAVRGRKSLDDKLGTADWGAKGGTINQISRTRLKNTESLGVITGQGDEAVGLSPELRAEAEGLVAKAMTQGKKKAFNAAAREVRPPSSGLLLLYPISRFSGYDIEDGKTREAIYSSNPDETQARDLVGLAISFPRSEAEPEVEAYVTGTVEWLPTPE